MKHESVPVGTRYGKEGESFTDLGRCVGGCGFRGTFVSTVISPYSIGTPDANFMSYMFGVFHVLVWVVVLAMSAWTGFGVSTLQAPGSNFTLDSDFAHDPTASTKTIGMIGGISTIVGVLSIVFFASVFTKSEYESAYFIDLIVQFATMYGLVCAYYVFYHAAEKTGSMAYVLSLITVILYSFAQSLLFSCTAMLATDAQARVGLVALALSLQLVTAIDVNGDDYGTFYDQTDNTTTATYMCFSKIPGAQHVDCSVTDTEKMLAWVAPGVTAFAFIYMAFIRLLVQQAKAGSGRFSFPMFKHPTGTQTIVHLPLFRSIIVSLFLCATIIQLYIYEHIDTAKTIHSMFTFVSTVAMMIVMALVLVPHGEPSGSSEFSN